MRHSRSLAFTAALVITATASAAVVYTTLGPFGGFLGLWGTDLFVAQSAAARFIPASSHTFDNAKFWLMNNARSTYGNVVVRLELDASEVGMGTISRPSGIALESWSFNIQTLGWNPVQHTMTSATHPILRAGRKYCIVASSNAAGGNNPVWNFASEGTGFTAVTQANGTWSAGSGAALTLTVNGTLGAPIAGDVNRDGVVNATDLAALLAQWGALQPFAGDADVNQNGFVDSADLAALLSGWQ